MHTFHRRHGLGADGFGYTGSTIPFSWTDISGTGTFVPLGDDQVSGAVPIGFTFSFYGIDYTQAYISSNGFITFSSGQSNGCCSGQNLPNPGSPNNLVAGYWEDFNLPQGGIHYQTLGTAGSRRFIVQFTNNPHYNGGPRVWFQMILHECSNDIELQFLNCPSDGGIHTTGIENSTGTIGLLYNFGNFSLVNTGLLIKSPNTYVKAAKPRPQLPSLLSTAQNHISEGNGLLKQADDLLKQAQDKGKDCTQCEKMIDEAKELLSRAIASLTNPIHANNLAMQALEKLRYALDCLKALLG